MHQGRDDVDTPLFSRTYDLVNWLLKVSNHFPRNQRFMVTKRLVDAGLDFQEQLLEANGCRGAERGRHLSRADITLDKVRLYLRLAYGNRWLSEGQYGHASEMVAEIGRLLGGWRRATK